MKILTTKVRKALGNPTVHYLLEKEEFLKSFVGFLNNRKLQIQTKDNSIGEQTNNKDYEHNLDTETTDEKATSCLAGSCDHFTSKIVALYFRDYEEKYGEPHPRLKKAQLQAVQSRLKAFAEEYYTELEDFHTIIQAHFSRTDGLVTDGNINHFATKGILHNLYYRHCY